MDIRVLNLLNARVPFVPYTLQVGGCRDIIVKDPGRVVRVRAGLIRIFTDNVMWELDPASIDSVRFERESGGGNR